MPKLPLWPTAALVLAGLATAPAAHAASPPATITATPITKALTTKGATATVTVRNTGKARLTGLSLRPAGAKGLVARISGSKRGVRTLKPLAAGKRTTVRVTLRRTKTGPRSGVYGLRLRRKGKVVASGRIAFGPGAKPAPAPEPETLTGRYYWGSLYTINGIEQYTLLFTNPGFVFTGDAEGSYPTCTAVTEDCRPYTYDPKTKALSIDGKPATIEGNKLTLDGQTHFLLGAAAPGARWDTVLTYSNSSGVCPLYCSYFTEHLRFQPDGRFIRGAVASGTTGTGDYAVVPADQKGTYEVRPDRTLLLQFADGKQRIETLAIFPDAAGAYPANPTAGIVLNGDGYFDIRD